MNTKLSEAVEEAGSFLDGCTELFDSRELRLASPVHDDSVTLGSLRALYRLGREMQEIFDMIRPKDEAATGGARE